MACMTEETFGPTLPIMKVADAEEAIRLANDSPYGLAASVFSKDVARGEAVARRIEAGAVCVNDALINYTALELPMGGAKASGLGSRHGAGGIRKYIQQQALLVSRLHPKRELHMYPYNAKMTRRLGKLRPPLVRARQARLPKGDVGGRRRHRARPTRRGAGSATRRRSAAREACRPRPASVTASGSDAQELGGLLDGEHVGSLGGDKLRAPHGQLARVGCDQRRGQGGAPEHVALVEALGDEQAHDVALGDAPLEGEAVELLGCVDGETDEEGRGLVVAALALLGHAAQDSSTISRYQRLCLSPSPFTWPLSPRH